MYKCVFIAKKMRPNPDALAGYFFFNDFKWLQHRQIKTQFSLVFVFSFISNGLCSKDDSYAAIA